MKLRIIAIWIKCNISIITLFDFLERWIQNLRLRSCEQVHFDFNANFKISTLNNRFWFHILELFLLAMNPRHETLIITKVLNKGSLFRVCIFKVCEGGFFFFFLWEPRMLKCFRCSMFQLKSQPSFYCVCNQPKTQGSKCWFLSFYLVCFMSFWTTCEVLKCFLTCFKVQNTNFGTQLNLEIWYSYLHVEGGALCALDVLSFRWNYNPPSNCACNHLKTWVKILVFWDSMFIIRMCKLNFSLGNFWSSKPFLCKL